MKSSDDSPLFEFGAVCAFLVAVVATSADYFYRLGCLLFYGDAQAHLNISRSIFDSRTPGYDQLGTVWLPLLHLICLPFVRSTRLWSNGLAGTIPVACCFVAAGLCLYYAALEAYSSKLAAVLVLLCFAANPNILYLAGIPMTEMVFLAGLSGFLLALLRFRRSQRSGYLAAAIAASWLMSLTRYDGWFLIPFAGLAMAWSARHKRLATLVVFYAAAAAAPCYWMAHNWWETGNALDFYNGPYSAVAIQANKWYPGYQDWTTALRYYYEAAKLCSGLGLLLVGVVGFACAIWRRKFLGCAMLSLTPLFYLWSMHSSKGSPIFLPTLWPHGYYNSRYGIAVEVACAFSAGAVILLAGRRQLIAGALVAAIAIVPWLASPSRDNWICWKESQKNSDARRAWTAEAQAFFESKYQRGDGVLTECCGDLIGILGAAKIPMAESLHEGNGPAFLANTASSGLLRQSKWAIAQAGDKLATQLAQSASYEVVQTIQVPKAPALLIYERKNMRGPL